MTGTAASAIRPRKPAEERSLDARRHHRDQEQQRHRDERRHLGALRIRQGQHEPGNEPDELPQRRDAQRGPFSGGAVHATALHPVTIQARKGYTRLPVFSKDDAASAQAGDPMQRPEIDLSINGLSGGQLDLVSLSPGNVNAVVTLYDSAGTSLGTQTRTLPRSAHTRMDVPGATRVTIHLEDNTDASNVFTPRILAYATTTENGRTVVKEGYKLAKPLYSGEDTGTPKAHGSTMHNSNSTSTRRSTSSRTTQTSSPTFSSRAHSRSTGAVHTPVMQSRRTCGTPSTAMMQTEKSTICGMTQPMRIVRA
jgi:hypothetical protein